jgi:hypothetical protein
MRGQLEGGVGTSLSGIARWRGTRLPPAERAVSSVIETFGTVLIDGAVPVNAVRSAVIRIAPAPLPLPAAAEAPA